MSTDVTGVLDLSDAMAGEIRAWMGRRNIRQSDLARLLGTNEQWLSTRLRGHTPLGVNDAERIAAALGVTFVDLIPRGRRAVTETYPRIRIPGPRTPVTRPSQKHVRPPDGRPGQPDGSRRPRYIGRP